MQTSYTPLAQPLWGRERPNWLRYSEAVGLPKEDRPKPDFLTICPARTGTTWLARHLGRHPGIYVPAEKELRYFDVRWRLQGIDWYQQQFQDAGGRLKGESTPSYALLPETAIRTIQRMNPRLKLIFLARRLPERAWSHTQHGCRHYEGAFRDRMAPLDQLPRAALARDFLSDYALSSADYCGTLRRWLSYFPLEQFHVRYFEDAVTWPEAYFGELLRFLGVDKPLPPDNLHIRVNPGGGTGLPDWADPFLENLFASRQDEIEIFLKRTFGLHPTWRAAKFTRQDPIWLEDNEAGWRVSLHDGDFGGVRLSDDTRIHSRFLHDLQLQMSSARPGVALTPEAPAIEESRLEVVLRDLAEEFEAAQVIHVGVLRGFNIVRWKKLFFGIRQAIGAVDVTEETEELRSRWSTKDLVVAPLRSEVEAHIRILEADRSDSAGRIAPPSLLGCYRGFNLVDYDGVIHGLRQSLGPVDLTCSTPAHQFAATDFVVDNSEAAVARRIDEIEESRANRDD